MEIDSIGQVVQRDSSQAVQTLNQLGDDYTTFLKLLTAQISNQDPLEPIDSTTFVTQLAQLTQVEQAAQTNLQLENLGAKLDETALVSSASLIGQTARFPTDIMVLDEQGASIYYVLDSDASSVVAEIYNPSGILVKSVTGLSGAANVEHSISWNGTTDSGLDAIKGNYYLKLRALDERENVVESSVYREAQIQEVNLELGQISFLVDGGQIVRSDDLLAVKS